VLPLLKPLGEDRYEDTTFDLALAPATPFQNVEFWRAGKHGTEVRLTAALP
jgi:hypothetical protein